MTRKLNLAATIVLAGSVGLGLAACGTENTASGSSEVIVSEPTDRSVPVVAGPKPESSSTTSSTSARQSTPDDAKSCGATFGPDGALQIHLVAGDVSCDEAKTMLGHYDAKMRASGSSHTVDGWECGPSQVTGELLRCTKDENTVALVP